MQILFYFLAFLLSMLTGMGVGSGGILTVYALEFLNLPPTLSVFCNLLLFSASFCCAAVFHIKENRICFSYLLPVLLLGIPGAYLGHTVMQHLPLKWLKFFLGLFLICIGIYSLIRLFWTKSKR